MASEEFSDDWIKVTDRYPGEAGHDSEEVFVFQNGFAAIDDHEARQGGPWGLSTGYYDVGRGCFMVGGRPNQWVSHWMPKVKPPASTARTYEPRIEISLRLSTARELREALKVVDGIAVKDLLQLIQYAEEELIEKGELPEE